MFCRRRQQTGAGAVGGLPMARAISEQVFGCRYRDRRDQQKQQDYQRFSHPWKLVRRAFSYSRHWRLYINAASAFAM
jgi:hypothetical protein